MKNKLISGLSFIKKSFKKIIVFLGYFFFSIVLLSFTDIPYYAYHYLGTANTIKINKPQLIILMAGNGMPSPDALIRCYYAANTALKSSCSKIIIAFPVNNLEDLYELKLMKNELVLRGVNPDKIFYEPYGYNTYSQAQNIVKNYQSDNSICVITSPEHSYRSIGAFRKAGFKYVTANPTFDNPLNEESIKDKSSSKDIRIESLNIRYNLWSYLNYELIVIREYCAIAYYWLKGWL